MVKAGMVFKSIFDSGGIVSIGAMAVYL
jgi:hypothetical protein